MFLYGNKSTHLPEAGGSGNTFELPELTNEGSAEDLRAGKELLDGNGNIVTGTYEIYEYSNGKFWTHSRFTNRSFNSVYYADGIWVACGSGLYYSTDGITWTRNSNNIASENFNYVYNANSLWVLSSKSNKGLYYSTDGKWWVQSNITSGYFYKTYNANGIWVASSSKGLYYSTNGKVWTQSNITSGFDCVYNANGIWVAGSSNGLYYSTDGMTWI